VLFRVKNKEGQIPVMVGEEYAYLEKCINEGSLVVALKHAEGADEMNTTQNDQHRCLLRTKSERKVLQLRHRLSEELPQVLWGETYTQAETQPFELGEQEDGIGGELCIHSPGTQGNFPN